MTTPRLEVTDTMGRRLVSIEKTPFAIGRRESNDLRLNGTEVSRDHAEIVHENNAYQLRDRGSRYGTYVNDEDATADLELRHGDRIRLGRGGGADLVFLIGDVDDLMERSTNTAIGDLRQVAALLEGLSALGSGRVLDDVLTMVLDAAIEVGNAERGFIMLANPEGHLEFKLARAAGRTPLPGDSVQTSRKIPEQVFETGQSRIVADLLDGDLANAHMGTVALGIRHVLCVPLRLVQYLDQGQQANDERRIGVLYLDSREKGSLLSNSTRTALETLATEAAVAIENARLYRYALERAKMDQEMQIAAEIQQALLPKAEQDGDYFGSAALSIASRLIGGDFFDYLRLSEDSFGFALGDVAGKGPPAALMSAMLQGIFAAQTAEHEGPSEAITRINQVLYRRGVENRFVTIFYGVLRPDGELRFCNAGHNAPFLVAGGGVQRLEDGGPIVGLFDGVPFAEATVRLSPGDWVVVFSDGVSEALSATGEEFGDDRIEACITRDLDIEPSEQLSRLIASVQEFTAGAPQNDDVTAMVVRYTGRGTS